MEDATVQVILGGFRDLGKKIDDYAKQHADLRVEVESAKGDIASLKDESTSNKIRDYIGYAVSLVMAGVLGIHIQAGK